MRRLSIRWGFVTALLLLGVSSPAHALEPSTSSSTKRYTAEDAIALAIRTGKIKKVKALPPKKPLKFLGDAIDWLTSGSGTISHQHVQQVLSPFIKRSRDSFGEQTATILRGVLTHPNFMEFAEPSAKLQLISTIHSFEKLSLRNGLERWQRSQSRSRAFDRELYGY